MLVFNFSHQADAKPAKQCNAKQLAAILAPARPEKKTVKVYCSVKLPKKSYITKRVYFQGVKASDIEFNCNGAVLDGRAGQIGAGKDMIVVRSRKDKSGVLRRPENVTIRNCKVLGSVKIIGMSPSGEGKVVKASSHSRGHTKRAQNAAPKNIKLLNLSITAQGRIPLYIAPGVTKLTFAHSVIKGHTRSVAIYLDAESAYNVIKNNRFKVKTTKRELIAVDGSAHNTISRNIFTKLSNGGIYVYRNCGEGGTVRHQKPQYNTISNNGFFYRKFKGYKKRVSGFGQSISGFGKKKYVPAIWVGSRNGNRKYCSYDNGFGFGSSKSNADFAQKNIIINNQIMKLNPKKMIRTFSKDNKIKGNKTVKKIKLGKRAELKTLQPKTVKPKTVREASHDYVDFFARLKVIMPVVANT